MLQIKSFLTRIAVSAERRKNALFRVDPEKQRRFLLAQPEPSDDIQRSYLQYRCQVWLMGRWKGLILDVCAWPMTLALLRKYRRPEEIGSGLPVQRRAVFFRDGKPANILPAALRTEFPDCVEDPAPGEYLRPSDLAYLRKLRKRYPGAWHFHLKMTIKVARYRAVMEQYLPGAIFVCNEYSFTSSALTDYCTKNNVKHINVMHGEKLYYIRDSFFRFDRCYVWEEEYAQLFCALRAAPEQFRVAVPPSLIFPQTVSPEKTVDATYYLGAETGSQLQNIASSLKTLQERGWRIAVRPHPRYSDPEEISRCFGSFADIENTKEMCIEASVLRTKYAISLYSTVLHQAACNRTGIILDDVSDPEKYETLRTLQYVCMKIPHETLSKLLKGNQNETSV